MNRFALFAYLAVALMFALDSPAGEMPQHTNSNLSVIHGGNQEMSHSASRDSVYLIGPWGSGAVVNGQFQDQGGVPDWNGWTSRDLTQNSEVIWHVDTYNVVSGVYSAWCGDISYSACTPEDPVGGYASSYNEYLSWYGTIGNVNAATTVEITATVNHNTEPGYDFSNLGYYKDDNNIAYLWTADGEGEQVAVTGLVTYQPGEYVAHPDGGAENQVHITWHVTSDGGWDDSDCSYYGDGALQIDDITVTLNNDGGVTSTVDDFEDNTLGNWVVEFPQGVGDYAHLRSRLSDEDPCANNYSPQVCFIADDIMLAERGLPVAYCIDWCYGPGGYIVSTTGGAAGLASHVHNAVESPIISWPYGDYQGLSFLFDVYRHEDLSADSPGMFYTWGVRSTASANPEDIKQVYFKDRNFIYYGGPDYFRGGDANVTDLVVSGRTHVQVQLAVYELYSWGWYGDDGYPAPYFDNVSLICYEHFGPSLVARELDLAQDAFPEDGNLYSGTQMNLNNVRFDMANNISLATDLRNDPGDSIVVDIVPVRTGSVLVESDVDAVVKAPRLHWTLEEGVSVDISWRFNLTGAEGAGYTGLDDNGNLCGEVPGAHAMANGVPHPVKWMFDLPDNGFLFPGDVLHYYIEAWDDVLGNHQNATLPADLTSFGDFSDPRAYNTRFVVRALPALFDDSGDQPTLLFWNDFASHDGQNMWYNAFANLGFNPGWVYDSYYTNAPSSGVGNGLGGRASGGQLYGYDIMVYTCGDLATSTITNQDYDRDAGDDVGVVTDWMAQGGKHLFTTGDGLVYDLNRSGTSTQAFVTDYMGLSYVSNDVRPLLGGDTAPVVTPVAGNSVFQTTDSWIAFGGCSRINTFDAVTVNEGEPLAVFNDGITGYSAATKYVAANGSKVISMPYDFMFIRTPPTTPAKAKQLSPLPARVRLLKEVLTDFNLPPGIYMPTSVDLPSKVFAATAYPNPFNPLTKIKFTMPKAGHLSLKIFNVRGELVRTLINEATAEGPGAVMWDGSSDQGHLMSSGVYFYEARTAGGVKVNKMTLVR